ncbi:hypothetical protein F2P81_010928 [Scophthalmus maximus]|uniref:Uncharacterized protein n=1 Tax=Scophthalmus maximus TaxID=52904 RepID=A0A6A4T499_SCOMX|nr:hypothetical protein F2P81_010928 [Scophthalmus maximus]
MYSTSSSTRRSGVPSAKLRWNIFRYTTVQTFFHIDSNYQHLYNNLKKRLSGVPSAKLRWNIFRYTTVQTFFHIDSNYQHLYNNLKKRLQELSDDDDSEAADEIGRMYRLVLIAELKTSSRSSHRMWRVTDRLVSGSHVRKWDG